MDQAVLQSITVMLTQLGIAGIALWAWIQERGERIASQRTAADREAALHEKYQQRERELHADNISLIREMWRDSRVTIPTTVFATPPNGNTGNTSKETT